MRPINRKREQCGAFVTLFAELKKDPDLFFRYTRMDVDTFYELLNMLCPYLQKKALENQFVQNSGLRLHLGKR